MQGIFIVRRPFKSNGLCFNSGEVVVPGQIKLFRSKCSEGKIALLTEKSLDSIACYVYRRTQVDITAKLRDLLDNGVPEETTNVSDEDIVDDKSGEEKVEEKVDTNVEHNTEETNVEPKTEETNVETKVETNVETKVETNVETKVEDNQDNAGKVATVVL